MRTALAPVVEELAGEGSAVDDLVRAIEELGSGEEISASTVSSESDAASEITVASLDASGGDIDSALFIRFSIVAVAATITWSMTVFGKSVVA